MTIYQLDNYIVVVDDIGTTKKKVVGLLKFKISNSLCKYLENCSKAIIVETIKYSLPGVDALLIRGVIDFSKLHKIPVLFILTQDRVEYFLDRGEFIVKNLYNGRYLAIYSPTNSTIEETSTIGSITPYEKLR